VGGARDPVALAAHGHFFVGPDNGLLAGVFESGTVHRIDAARLGLAEPSRTFHGRDLFAPAAADLADGRAVSELGPAARLQAPRALPLARIEEGVAHGVVISIDRFGNAITNIGRELLASIDAPVILVGDLTLPLVGTYSQLPAGGDGALVSSFDTVEIARRDGDAAAALGLTRGIAVRAQKSSPPARAGAAGRHR
jgi:S-adenosyl-L-methionine hydrolase (adenosine-forming)